MKAPLTMETYAGHKKILEDAINFLVGLKDCQGNQMLKSPKKTGFLGWCLSSHSFLSLYDSLVGYSPGSRLRYLLGYKFSQDHLELFFSAVRARGGFNDNPTALQFKSAYKRLLLRHEIQHGGGNCLLLDNTEILHITGNGITSLNIARKYDMLDWEPIQVNIILNIELS